MNNPKWSLSHRHSSDYIISYFYINDYHQCDKIEINYQINVQNEHSTG